MVRPLRFCEGVVYVPLTKGREAMIDIEDAPMVGMYNWHSTRMRGGVAYAKRGIIYGKHIQLHRAIMNLPDNTPVDHKNGDGLDCRRANMRPASKCQNAQNQRKNKANKSGYKGVYFNKEKSKWEVRIRAFKLRMLIGRYSSAYEAHEAYVVASKRLHGEFSRTF